MLLPSYPKLTLICHKFASTRQDNLQIQMLVFSYGRTVRQINVFNLYNTQQRSHWLRVNYWKTIASFHTAHKNWRTIDQHNIHDDVWNSLIYIFLYCTSFLRTMCRRQQSFAHEPWMFCFIPSIDQPYEQTIGEWKMYMFCCSRSTSPNYEPDRE